MSYRESRVDGGDGEENPSTAVVRTVAVYANLDPTDLPPLTDATDPDAIDDFVASTDRGAVTFHYAGYVVTVSADGEVGIEPLD